MIDKVFNARQAGRMLQRLFEIETYRMMALLALPVARQHSARLAEIENTRASVTTDMASAEVTSYYTTSLDPSRLPGLMKKRAQVFDSTNVVGELTLLPHGERVASSMRLRAGFAYWAKDFQPQPCHPEELATVAVLLQRAREHDKLLDERRLSTPSFRRVVLDPENFSRFNDGVL